ncbi:MAG: 50S ribosomal protein L29 [Opitutales bacterium]|nr:50S ribosomal protein L29 [Opitutales bacterium]
MKSKEIRELSANEIEKKIRDSRETLLQTRLRKQTGQLEQPHLLQSLRREIARMETILVEKISSES